MGCPFGVRRSAGVDGRVAGHHVARRIPVLLWNVRLQGGAVPLIVSVLIPVILLFDFGLMLFSAFMHELRVNNRAESN